MLSYCVYNAACDMWQLTARALYVMGTRATGCCCPVAFPLFSEPGKDDVLIFLTTIQLGADRRNRTQQCAPSPQCTSSAHLTFPARSLISG